MPPRPRLHLLVLPTPSSLLFSAKQSPLAACLLQQTRCYAPPQKKPARTKKSKAARTYFKPTDLSEVDQFSLVDAMRYIRAFEVGKDPVATKYEIHIKLRTQKSGPTIKSRIRLPKPVKTDMRICVIAEGRQAEAAKAAGAWLVGTEDVFEKIRNGEIEFDKCICHDESFIAFTKARLGRILGPKGLMPSQKFGTVVPNVASAMRELTGKLDYRERMGVIRMAVGQLAFTEQELQRNIKALIEQLKGEMGAMSFRADKSINEVVLSSTQAPGFSLSGEFRNITPIAVPVAEGMDLRPQTI